MSMQIQTPYNKISQQIQSKEKSCEQQNRRQQFILGEQEIEQKKEQLTFSKLESQIKLMIQAVILKKLQQRNTILLAKLANQSILQAKKNKDNVSSQINFQLQNPLILKSVDEINRHYCNDITVTLIKQAVEFLKLKKYPAKAVVNTFVVENAHYGFNLGGVCFWSNGPDGQVRIIMKIPPVKQSNKQFSSRDQYERQGLIIVVLYLCKFEKAFIAK